MAFLSSGCFCVPLLVLNLAQSTLRASLIWRREGWHAVALPNIINKTGEERKCKKESLQPSLSNYRDWAVGFSWGQTCTEVQLSQFSVDPLNYAGRLNDIHVSVVEDLSMLCWSIATFTASFSYCNCTKTLFGNSPFLIIKKPFHWLIFLFDDYWIFK